MLNSILGDEMFCGCGPLIHKILHKGWRTSQVGKMDYEDYFQEFAVLWLKRRSQFDPSRGKMTTFAGVVALNFVRGEIKKADRRSRVSYGIYQEADRIDAGGEYIEFDQEEIRLIEAYENQVSKKVVGLNKRLCEATRTDKKTLLETAESIRTKVVLRAKPKVLVLA